MNRNNKQNGKKKRIEETEKHKRDTGGGGATSDKIDPMGTEVMQEDEYQRDKHGELPEEEQNKNPENKN